MGRIQRLDEAVVNKIAAGEVIQRPSNALKELLENSLDAGATQITVTVKDGGSRLLQVSDNGTGIQKDDLPILCERHTTSKLTNFSQLEQGINTLGFRGEALSSISYVAHLVISTMTASDSDNPDIGHGWKVTYKDGIMDSGGPRPCAATVGTTITVEDLFYNVPLRKKALRSASEEYNAILDVCGRYAVHKTGVGVTVKRQGEARSDMNTVATATRQDNIRSVFGSEVAKHLLPVDLKIQADDDDHNNDTDDDDDALSCQVTGYVSGADYNGKKKTTMVLFINDRSVECTPLKRALEATYTAMLPKAIRPFIYLDIKLPGHHVDVNLHPTKKEVGFLHQEQLIEAVRGAAESALTGSNDSRTFVQTLLPGATQPPLPTDSLGVNNNNNSSEEAPRYYRPDRLVRTDAKTQTLHAFMPSQQQQQQTMVGTANEDVVRAATAVVAPKRVRTHDMNNNNTNGGGEFAFMPTAMDITATQQMRRPVRHQSNDGITTTNNANNNPHITGNLPHLSSLHNTNNQEAVVSAVQQLISSFEKASHPGLTDIFQNYTWVGMADNKRALLQHGTRLYLIDVYTLSKDMFYQQALRRLGAGRKIKILPGLSLQALAMTALEGEEVAGRWKESVEEGTKDEVTQLLCTLLVERKAELLAEYFAIEIEREEEDGGEEEEEGGNTITTTNTKTAAALVHSLPQLIEHYTPDLSRLPAFILALGQKVIWSDEKRCISTIAEALSDLYAAASSSSSIDKEEDQWTMQHVILPALKAFLRPGRHRASDGSIVELTRLETLYKVFERC